MNNKRNLYFGVIGMVLGITLALIGILYYDYFLHAICISVGIVIILVNIYPLLFSFKEMKYNKRFIYMFITSLIFILLGIAFIINHDMIISIIFGIFLILLSFIRILLAKNHKMRFLHEVPYILLGLALVLNISHVIFQVAIVVFGILLAMYSGLYLLLIVFGKIKRNDNEAEEAN